MFSKTQSTRASRNEIPLSILVGAIVAALLFVVMAISQMLGDVKKVEEDRVENTAAYVPPEIEVVIEEPPPPIEEEEPPPELEEAPQLLTLDQLDLALNPGTGGSLAGDFALPTIATSSQALGTDDFVDFSKLDEVPRPVGVTGFNFPRRLLKEKANGQVVLLLKLGEDGSILDVEIESSNLPRFNEFILNEVKGWRFTPPTLQGRAVKARARFPIPIKIT